METKAVRWFDDPRVKALEAALAAKRKRIEELKGQEGNADSRLARAREVLTDSRALASIGRSPSPTPKAAEDGIAELEEHLSRLRGERLALEAELPSDERAIEHTRRACAVECCQAIHEESAELVSELEELLARVVECNSRLDELHVLARVSFESQGDKAELTRSAGVPVEGGFNFSLRAHVSTSAALADWKARAHDALDHARVQFAGRQAKLGAAVKVA